MRGIRTIISSVTEGEIKRFSGTGRPGEIFTNREFIQQYGFTSIPLPGAEGLVYIEGNTVYLYASDDRRYRIALQNGEVALYTDEGDNVHLKRNKEIEINTGNKLTINATNEVTINTKDANVICTGKAAVTAQGGVDIDGGSGNIKGVVQGDSICHFTGLAHADISTNVKASK